MRLGGVLPLAALAVLTACAPSGGAPGDAEAPGAGAVREPGAVETALVESLARSLEILEGKMVGLARAMPGDSYGWRPMEGVRSVGDVYAHAGGDNWYVQAILGIEVPPGTGVTTDGATVGAYEKAAGDKDDIVAGMEASFTTLRAALDASRADMGRTVVLGENSITVADLWVRAIVHLHEHLGQSIAYARANGVVPPWSN